MTDKIQIDRTVVEQALEALFMYKPMVTGVTFQHGMGAMQALRAALEQPKGEQETVGEAGSMPGTDGFTMACFRAIDVPVGTKLYIRPQPPRQPLTREEIAFIAAACGGLASDFVVSVARAIEAAHGVKGRK